MRSNWEQFLRVQSTTSKHLLFCWKKPLFEPFVSPCTHCWLRSRQDKNCREHFHQKLGIPRKNSPLLHIAFHHVKMSHAMPIGFTWSTFHHVGRIFGPPQCSNITKMTDFCCEITGEHLYLGKYVWTFREPPFWCCIRMEVPFLELTCAWVAETSVIRQMGWDLRVSRNFLFLKFWKNFFRPQQQFGSFVFFV